MKKFKKIYIEITNQCNLKCEFCPKTKRPLARNTSEEFEYVIREIKPYTDYIYLHLLGEPTMHPELERYLQISEENGLKVNITTNGTLLDKVQPILVNAKALRQINISLHSFEVNDHQIKLYDYLNKIVEFINEITQKSSVICSLRLWNMDNEKIVAKNKLNHEILHFLEEKLELDFSLEKALEQKDGIQLKPNIYLNKAYKFQWPDKNLEEITDRVFCHGLRDQIGILVDGTVVPCCLDSEGDIKLGNIYKTPLKEILQSEKSQSIYNHFSNRKAIEPLCKRCGYATRY